MSDPSGAKRFEAEARATCTKLDEAAKTLLQWATRLKGDEFPLVPPAEVEALAHALAHQGGRLDLAASMAHTRRKRK